MNTAAMRLFLAFSVAALGVAGCTSTPTTEDPVFLKLTDLEARLIRIERVIDNQSLIELSMSVDQLRSQTQLLRGEIDTLRFESDNAADRQRQLYLDVDGRLQQIEIAQAQAAEAPPVAVADLVDDSTASTLIPRLPPVMGSDQDNYQVAFDLLRNQRYAESAEAFQQFLTVFPSSPLADNAQYWLAETFYVQRQFTTALPTFESVVDQYPDSIKLPDALLKIGFCNYELQQWDAAREALLRVSREFPDTTPARLALQRLQRMDQEQL